MQIISKTLDAIEVGPAQSFRNLTLFPLLHPEGAGPAEYLTLDEALAAGVARVTEVGTGGSVPELRFVNDGDTPVLLLDGEELVGAKQNRVLNLTILVASHDSIVIPVSCVESGRWGYGLAETLSSSPHVMYSRVRAAKASHVSASMRMGRSRRSDQGAVWDDIALCARVLDANAPTSAMQDVYKRHETRIEDYVRGLPWIERQTGAIFAIDGRITGLEVLDRPSTTRRLLPKLVRSYALDAIASRVVLERPPEEQSARDFVAEVAAAETETQDALGLGEDVRLAARGLAGGALVHEGRVVHLGAFRLEEEAREGGGGGERSRIRPASLRGRGWRRAG